MTLTAFPNGISSFGVPIMGSGATLPATTGTYYFVHSGTGAAGNDGKSSTTPLATIDQAVNKCTADKNDVVVVMPGHAESIAAAAGIDADIAGISIVGLGNGENRPVVTFTTAAGADLDVDAANITISGIVFKNDIDSQTAMIDVNAAGFTMEKCDLLEGTSKQALIYMDLAEDRATIRNCYVKSIAAGANSGIKIAAAKDRITIEGCVIDGDFADAGIHNPTGTIATNVVLRNNIVRNRQTGDHAIELVSACTGEATGNSLSGDTFGTVFDPGSLFCANNYETIAADDPGYPSPVSSVSRFPVEKFIAIKRSSVFDGGTTNAHGDDGGTSDPYTLFTVTGDVLVWGIWGVVNTDLTNATATIEVGVAGNTAGLIAQETGTDLDDGNIYTSATNAVGVAALAGSGAPFAINDGADIIETVATADVTGGQIDYYCIWSPAEPGATVVAA